MIVSRRRRTRFGQRWSRAIALVAVLSTVGSAARAQEPSVKEEAAAIVDRAQKLEAQGDFAAASEQYRAAYKLVPHPVLLFNLAQVFRQAGDPLRAYHFYDKYLIIEPNGELSQLARRFVAELSEELGTPVPDPPMDDDILVPQEAAPEPPPPKQDDATGVVDPAVNKTAAPRGRHITPATWVFGGLSLAAVGVGSYFAVTSARDYNACEDRGTCETDEEVDSIKRRAIVGDALFGVSLACAVTAAIIYWRSDSESPRVGVAVGEGAASVSWMTRF